MKNAGIKIKIKIMGLSQDICPFLPQILLINNGYLEYFLLIIKCDIMHNSSHKKKNQTHWQSVASYFELFSTYLNFELKTGMKEVKLYNHMLCHFQTILIPPIDNLLPPILNCFPPIVLFLFFYSDLLRALFLVGRTIQ